MATTITNRSPSVSQPTTTPAPKQTQAKPAPKANSAAATAAAAHAAADKAAASKTKLTGSHTSSGAIDVHEPAATGDTVPLSKAQQDAVNHAADNLANAEIKLAAAPEDAGAQAALKRAQTEFDSTVDKQAAQGDAANSRLAGRRPSLASIKIALRLIGLNRQLAKISQASNQARADLGKLKKSGKANPALSRGLSTQLNKLTSRSGVLHQQIATALKEQSKIRGSAPPAPSKAFSGGKVR